MAWYYSFRKRDEPICSVADIRRAGGIRNVGFCKLKLKRFGGLALVAEALAAGRSCGMEPVLGDGLGTELSCWMEACIAGGGLILSPGPTLDRDVMAAREIVCEGNGVLVNARR